MDSHLKKGVKEVIEQFPRVGQVLEGHGIGCVTCAVGTCLLGDIVSIHGLSPAEESAVMAEIKQAIAAGPEALPAAAGAARSAASRPREFSYSPPVGKLVEEHTLIKRLLALIPAMVEEARLSGRIDAEVGRGALDFIRGYADRFHHMKEEDILFDYTDRGAEIIRVIQQDHETARGHVRAAAEAIDEEEVSAFAEHLLAYRELLTEHITKEDEILYPYIDRGLSDHQVGEIARRAHEAESQVSADVPGKYERFVLALEKRYGEKEGEQCPTITTDVPAHA